MKYTFTKTRDLVLKLNNASNQNQLEIYLHLAVLEKEGIWQNKQYYEGDSQLESYADAPFSIFIKGLGKTEMWYKSLQTYLDLPNGEKLFTRYGKGNMATYVNSTEEERKAILEAAEKSNVIPSFNYLKRKLFPGNVETKPQSVWKEKYHQLKKEFEKYKHQMEKDIEALKATIRILAGEETQKQTEAK